MSRIRACPPQMASGANFTPAYGEIYVEDASTPQVLDTTPSKLTGFTVNGASSNTAPDHTNDQITINATGIYKVSFQASFGGTIATTFEVHFRVDGVEQAQGLHRKLGTGGDVGSASITALLSLTAGEVLTIFGESDNAGGANFTPVDMQLNVTRIA